MISLAIAQAMELSLAIPKTKPCFPANESMRQNL
jgi:hypothetical protein